jgi:DNA-binding NarL/FixJ family response regulator
MNIAVAVIDDHVLMRDLLLKACLEAVPGCTAVGAGDGRSGLTLCQTVQPDLIVLDLALPDCDGLDLLDDLLAVCRQSKVIGISGYSDDFTLHRALKSKLQGFVDKKEQTLGQLSAAIHAVLKGERYLSPAASKARLAMRNDPVAFDKILSVREQQLLSLFGQGLSNEQIAARVNLSELTVRNHRCRTMAKLGLRTSTELIRYAMEKGFVRLETLQRADHHFS